MSAPAGAVAAPARNLRAAMALLAKREEVNRAALSATGFRSVEELTTAIADHFRLPRLELDQVELSSDMTKLVSRTVAEKHRVIPVFASKEELTLATADPSRIELFDYLKGELRRSIVVVISSPPELERAFKRLYDVQVTKVEDDEGEGDQISAEQLVEAIPIVNHLILKAVELKASDIHIEAGEKGTTVRCRVDGMLREVETRPREQHAAIVSRLKVMASLDISERAAPQDGRIKVTLGQKVIDLRVSVLPTYFGEKVCCRILDNSRATLPLAELGFEADQMEIFNRLVKAPYGLVLVTGPTGSGKSTTLYGALNAVRHPSINIVSVEDPVEYQLPGINQVQVNPKRNLTFASALKSILRQDPNVILVGEIRDRETGIIAAEAAITGHLVFASLHTNDAVTAVTRLSEMGIESYLMAPALLGVVAQRLIRKVCENCKETYDPTKPELTLLGLPGLPAGTKFVRGRGCETCLHTGYKGRTAVRELLEISDQLKVAIGKASNAEELRAIALAGGFKSMRFQAMKKLFGGVTSVEEVVRLTRG